MILTESCRGHEVFQPKNHDVPLDLPFQLKRLQFTIKSAFDVSINKAQGQATKVAEFI